MRMQLSKHIQIVRLFLVTDSKQPLRFNLYSLQFYGLLHAFLMFSCCLLSIVLQAVELWLVDRAVIPIENSVAGSIHRNYDLLLRHRLHIVGEVQLDVNHCLMGLPGIRKEDLKRVLSHPQVLRFSFSP